MHGFGRLIWSDGKKNLIINLINQEENMRVIMKMIKKMEMEYLHGRMEESMSEDFLMENNMEWDIQKKMEKRDMVNLRIFMGIMGIFEYF